jgi:hypothetical protein
MEDHPMKRSLLLLALWVSLPASTQAGFVIHDGSPGIVAASEDEFFLDSLGQAWVLRGSGWTHEADYDVPIPVEDIKLWERSAFVTMDNSGWVLTYNPDPEWLCMGQWPGYAGLGEERDPASRVASVAPNPSSGLCRIAFRMVTPGSVTVSLFDATGRMVRQLLGGPQPVGDYILIWDGRDDSGCDVPSGVYAARITTPTGTHGERLILTR